MNTGRRDADARKVEKTRADILTAVDEIVRDYGAKKQPIPRVTKTEVARRAGRRSVSTISRYFDDWEHMCAELVERKKAGGVKFAELPVEVRSYAQQHWAKAPARPHAPSPPDVAEFRTAFALARDQDNLLTLASAARNLIEYLRADGDTPSSNAIEVIHCAEAVFEKIDDVSRGPAIEAWLSVADAAVDAHRNLAIDEAETEHLMHISWIKERDRDYSRTLGRHVRAIISDFHKDRAEALIANRPQREIDALNRVVQQLDQEKSRTGDCPDSDALLMLTSRTCAAALAYPDLTADGRLRDNLATLRRLFRSDYENRQRRLDAWSLDRIMVTGQGSATDLLRASRFQGPGDFLIARQLRARAQDMDDDDLIKHYGTQHDSPNQVRLRLLRRSIDFYARVQQTIRARGCGAELAKIAAGEARKVAQSFDEIVQRDPNLLTSFAHEPSQDLAQILDNVNDLVLRTIIGVTLENAQIARLVNSIDPILKFLTKPKEYGIVSDLRLARDQHPNNTTPPRSSDKGT